MRAAKVTAEQVQEMIQTALAAQATIHQRDSDTREWALITEFETRLLKATAINKTPPGSSTSSTRSTVPRTCLNMGSQSVLYNGLGGTSTSAMSNAAVGRASALASASSSSTSTQEEFYKLLTMDQSKIEKSLNEREEDPVTDSGLVASLKLFDDYNHRGGRKSLRELLGHTWFRILEWVQGVTIPDESDGDSELRNFMESIFNSPESFNIRVETAFLAQKVELVKGRVSLDAMQTDAARFAATLDDWVPGVPDSNDRALNERLVSYFYNGIEPKPLRLLV